MAYNKVNKMKRIIEVQQCFKQHYKPGMIIEHVYRENIYPTFKISRTTFFEWMKTPAETLLKEIEENVKTKAEARQIEMGFAQETN